MAFTSIATIESNKESENVENEECSEKSEEEYDIHESYRELFEESLKIKKVNKTVLKKVNELEREREREKLIGDLHDSTKNLNELKLVNENLETKVKSLTSDLEKSYNQFHSFMSGMHKLDNLLGMNTPAGNRHGLAYVQNGNATTSTSKTMFV
jgi:molecular chaperone GrpE (heat shock protein)